MSYATQRPPIPASWSDIRWIGPIPEAPGGPAEFCPTDFDEEVDSDDQAPPGPAPVWGGYRPVRVLPRPWGCFAAGTIPTLEDDGSTEDSSGSYYWGVGDGQYFAHSSETRLLRVLRDGAFEWWVEAPRRLSQRAIGILLARLRDIDEACRVVDFSLWPDVDSFAAYDQRRKAAAAVASETTLYGVSDEEELLAAHRRSCRRLSVYSERPSEAYDAAEPEPEPVRARGRYTEDED